MAPHLRAEPLRLIVRGTKARKGRGCRPGERPGRGPRGHCPPSAVSSPVSLRPPRPVLLDGARGHAAGAGAEPSRRAHPRAGGGARSARTRRQVARRPPRSGCHITARVPEPRVASLGRGGSPWRRTSGARPGKRTALLTGMPLWLFRFAYLKTTGKAINSNLNNFQAQNYVYGLLADKFMGTSGGQASDTE